MRQGAAIIVPLALLLSGCDQTFSAIDRLVGKYQASRDPLGIRPAADPARLDQIFAQADAILASDTENIEILLVCPAAGNQIDGSEAKIGSTEVIYIFQKTSIFDPKKPKSPQNLFKTMDAKIEIATKKYEFNLVNTDGHYAVLSYADRPVDGISSNIRSITYMIDLTNKKFRRIVHSFPYGPESNFSGQCKLAPAPQK